MIAVFNRMCLAMDLNAVILSLFITFCNVLGNDLEEGSPCILKDGTHGVCLKLSDCNQASEDMKHLTVPKFCSLDLLNPLVCCLYCNFLQKRFLDGMSVEFALKFKLKVKFTDSGKLNNLITQQNRIHTGCLGASQIIQNFPCNNYEDFKDLDDSIRCYEYPFDIESFEVWNKANKGNKYHHLALIGHGDDPNRAIWWCSGSIISDQYILTAAHCTSNPELGEIKFVALGNLQRTEHRNEWQIYDVVQVIPHPAYESPSMYHDIALLKTGEKIKYNLKVIPACLQRGEDMSALATATGWGVIGQQKHSEDILKGADVIRFSDEACGEAYPKHRHLINGYSSITQACYGDEEHTNDSCEADRGGPLQVKTNKKNSKCLHTVIGVTTYGRACGVIGSAGLYTRVAPYLSWIENITGGLS